MVRIIAGEYRSRRLLTPEGTDKARPLPDRARVSLFNMLEGHIEGQSVLDVFAGVGSFGFEALSRGAARCVFVERDREMMRLLKENAAALGCVARCVFVQADALGPAGLSQADRPSHLVFFDPPFPMMVSAGDRGRVLAQFARAVQLLDDDGYAILRVPVPMAGADEETDDEALLEIPGAAGPEVHDHRQMALCWYMRAR
ncbi:MAG: RsmD family RNA methyltransferase [Phycisphaerales bacterium]